MAKSLFKDVLLVAVFSVLARALGFFFKIYLSRSIGAELLGVYHVAISIFMVFVLLVSSGIPVTVSKMTARFKASGRTKQINSVASSSTILGVLVGLLVCVIVLVFQNVFALMFTDERVVDILVVLLPAVVASAVYASVRGIFWGEKDYFSVGWTETLEQVARIFVFAVLFGCLSLPFDGAMIAGIAMTVSCVVSMLAVLFVFFKKGKRFGKPKGYFSPVFKSSAPITGVRVVSSLIQPIVGILFPLMFVCSGESNEVAMSVFGEVMGMSFPLLFLPVALIGALSFALIPELSTAIEKGQTKLAQERIKTGMTFSVLASALIVPLYLAFGVEICSLVYDNIQSGKFLIWASFIMIPLGLSNITSSVLNALNLEVKSFVNNLLGGVILILSIVCLTGVLKVFALIVGFGLCMLITTFLNVLMIKKATKQKLGLTKPLCLSVLFAVFCALLSRLCFNLLLKFLPSFLSLVCAGGICVFFFVLLCMVFKLFDFAIIFSKIGLFSKIFHKNRKISKI